MDEELPPQKEFQSFIWRLFKEPKRLLIFVVLLALLIGFFGIFYLKGYLLPTKPVPEFLPTPVSPTISPILISREEALTTKGKFPQEQIVASIGKENLYGRDLNYKLFINFPEVLGLPGDVSEKIRKKVLDQIIEDSVILQTGEKMKLISLNDSVFNNPNKDYAERNRLITKATDELPFQVVKQIDGESISIWFYNVEPPKMGVEEAKRIVYAKMERIYGDIKGGKITFKEAGERIASDKELEEIDFAYKTNAYSAFAGVERDTLIFHDPELEKVLWTLKEEEISTILTGRDFAAEGRAYEAFFVVLKVNRRNFAGFSSFDDWLKAEKERYEIEILI